MLQFILRCRRCGVNILLCQPSSTKKMAFFCKCKQRIQDCTKLYNQLPIQKTPSNFSGILLFCPLLSSLRSLSSVLAPLAFSSVLARFAHSLLTHSRKRLKIPHTPLPQRRHLWHHPHRKPPCTHKRRVLLLDGTARLCIDRPGLPLGILVERWRTLREPNLGRLAVRRPLHHGHFDGIVGRVLLGFVDDTAALKGDEPVGVAGISLGVGVDGRVLLRGMGAVSIGGGCSRGASSASRLLCLLCWLRGLTKR